MNQVPMMALGAVIGAMTAADRAGVLHALVEAPATVSALAEQLSLDPRALGLVLEVLRSQGLVVVDGDDRVCATDALCDGLKGPTERAGSWTAFWASTESFLRSGEQLWMRDDTRRRARAYAHVTPLLGEMFLASAASLAGGLAGWLRSRESPRILDVGAGSGVWSQCLLQLVGKARATGLDLPGVTARYHERARQFGVSDRVQTVEADFHAHEVEPASWDVILLANVLHLECAERARAVVSRFAAGLREGGRVVVIDAFADGSPEQVRFTSAYALHLALRMRDGTVHPEDEVRRWLSEAGQTTCERWPLASAPPGLSALVAWR